MTLHGRLYSPVLRTLSDAAFLSVMLQFKTMLYSQCGGDRRVRLNEGRECGVRLEHAVSFVVGIQLLDAANEVRESRKHSEEEDPTSHGIEALRRDTHQMEERVHLQPLPADQPGRSSQTMLLRRIVGRPPL